jgi:hypothetical protein
MTNQTKNKIVAGIVIGFVALVAVSIFAKQYGQWKTAQEAAILKAKQIEDCTELVEKVANSIPISDTGRFVRDVPIYDHDPWGEKLYIHFEEGEITDNVKLTSAGMDRKLRTPDDISYTRSRASLSVATGTVSKEVKRQVKGIFTND